ncbi:MAG: peptidylprolyl isomerase [Planctomycetota bacterium]|nr:peptidylprolyl isomerase [Planctomycetota bacterium]
MRRSPTLRVLLAVCLLLPLVACSSQQEDAVATFGNDRGADKPGPVAVVDGKRLSKAELADWWFDRYPEEYGRTLGALVDERLAIRAAHAQGIRVPRAVLEKAVAAEVEARRKQLSSLYGKEADLAAEVRRAYGVDVEAWRTRVLAPRLHARLLMERVIRWDTRRRERVHARVIVLTNETRAQDLIGRLRKGADFSLLAARESLDPSGKRGGDLPWIGRGDLAFPGVEERLFSAQAGGLVGPLRVNVEGREQFHVYKVIQRRPPWTGTADANWQRLEKDLADRPVGQGEFERWRARTRRDAGVRFYRPDGRVWQPPAGR